MSKTRKIEAARQEFVEGVDYYFDGGLLVMTEHYLLRRGFCCGNGCRHCPYRESASGGEEPRHDDRGHSIT